MADRTGPALWYIRRGRFSFLLSFRDEGVELFVFALQPFQQGADDPLGFLAEFGDIGLDL